MQRGDTRRSIWKPCAKSPCHGRERCHEQYAGRHYRLSGIAPISWLQAEEGRATAAGFCGVHGAAQRDLDHVEVGSGMGAAAGIDRSELPCRKAARHTQFCALSHRDRPAHRDSPNGSAAAATKYLPASYLPPGGDSPPSRRQPATTAGSQADLALVALYDLRPAERDRDACQRSTEPRSGPRCSDDTQLEVRKIPLGPGACDNMRHPETVPGAAQRVFGGTHRPAVLHIAAWPPDYALDLGPVVPPTVPETRIARHLGCDGATFARYAAHHGRRGLVAMLWRGRRPRAPSAGTFHLSGTHPSQLHVLVSAPAPFSHEAGGDAA